MEKQAHAAQATLSGENQDLRQQLAAAESRAQNADREIEVLRWVLRDKQAALLQHVADKEKLETSFASQLAAKEAALRELEGKLSDGAASSKREQDLLQTKLRGLQDTLRDMQVHLNLAMMQCTCTVGWAGQGPRAPTELAHRRGCGALR